MNYRYLALSIVSSIIPLFTMENREKELTKSERYTKLSRLAQEHKKEKTALPLTTIIQHIKECQIILKTVPMTERDNQCEKIINSNIQKYLDNLQNRKAESIKNYVLTQEKISSLNASVELSVLSVELELKNFSSQPQEDKNVLNNMSEFRNRIEFSSMVYEEKKELKQKVLLPMIGNNILAKEMQNVVNTIKSNIETQHKNDSSNLGKTAHIIHQACLPKEESIKKITELIDKKINTHEGK